MGRPYKCRYCPSTHTISKGYRKLSHGKVQVRRCKRCGRKFTTTKRIPDGAEDGK